MNVFSLIKSYVPIFDVVAVFNHRVIAGVGTGCQQGYDDLENDSNYVQDQYRYLSSCLLVVYVHTDKESQCLA